MLPFFFFLVSSLFCLFPYQLYILTSFIYQFPGVTSGIDLSVDVLSQLAPHPNIAGVKLTCANAGKVSCLTAQFPPSQFAVFSGQSDWLLPCLVAGGVGCVTGIGNVFPRAVAELYALWQAGRVDEARKLQGQVALAEYACKRGLNATKYGAGLFVGARRLGLTDPATFYPRKPYPPAGVDAQAATERTMGVLEAADLGLPAVAPKRLGYRLVSRKNKSNGVSATTTTNGESDGAKQKQPTVRTHFTLNTGAQIPAVGFGTWKAAPGEAGRAVEAALAAGYRHFDCAPLYHNEAEIGQILRATVIPREDLFVTTKLWSSDHRRASQALDKSLRDLGLEYVDLWLMHWPVTTIPAPDNSPESYGKEDRTVHDPDWDFRDTWREMERILSDGSGRVRAIGVANFSTVNLDKLLSSPDINVVPAVNQTELQPLLPQDKLHALCQARGIHQTAFGPLGGAPVEGTSKTLHDEPVVREIAEARGVSTANVLLSWGVARGWSVIPKSVNPERIAANLKNNFVPSGEEMKSLDGLVSSVGPKRFNRPNWGTTVFHDDDDDEATK